MDGPQATWQQPDPDSPWVPTPPPAGPLEPVAGPAGAVLVLSGVATVAELLGALVAFGSRPASSLDARAGVAVLTSVCWLAALVVTSVWLLRVRRNAERLSPWHQHARSRGWAWAGWVVPVVSLWFPFQVVRDALTASAGAHPGRLERPPLARWWAAWLVGQFLVNLAAQLAVGASAGVVAGTVHLLDVAALGLALGAWVRVVRTATALQTP